MTGLETRPGQWLQTQSGRRFYPLDPRPSDVHMAARAPMGRKALASALFRQYGSVQRGQFRPYTLWLQDADEVTAYARRYPNG